MGRPLPFTQGELTLRGHAIEARLYAEDADKDFLPQTGVLADFHIAPGEGLRVDSGVQTGDEVGIHYDPMLAKIIAWGADRGEANRRLARALRAASVQGVTTNLAFLRRVLAHPAWEAGDITTHFIADHAETLRPASPDRARAARIATLQRVVALDAERREAGGVLPGLPLGWRNNRFADPEVRWESGGETLAVGYRVLGAGRILTRSGGVEVEVELLGRDDAGDAASLVVRVGDAILRPRLVTRGESLWVHLPGEDVALTAVPRFVTAEKVKDVGSCRAPMPGKVIAVRVAVGEAVTVNQPLVVLEAMKMEHALDAPTDGTIAEVLVQPGDIVQADQELVRLQPATA
jgi:acetyl/propionyl-CoA carboxylase alpha subunit